MAKTPDQQIREAGKRFSAEFAKKRARPAAAATKRKQGERDRLRRVDELLAGTLPDAPESVRAELLFELRWGRSAAGFASAQTRAQRTRLDVLLEVRNRLALAPCYDPRGQLLEASTVKAIWAEIDGIREMIDEATNPVICDDPEDGESREPAPEAEPAAPGTVTMTFVCADRASDLPKTRHERTPRQQQADAAKQVHVNLMAILEGAGMGTATAREVASELGKCSGFIVEEHRVGET